MKKEMFGDHVRTEAKLSILQVGRLRVPATLQRAPQPEKDAFVLERARTFIDEAVLERALQKVGIARAGRAVRVVDAARGIVEAEADGQLVQASSNPFQQPGLYYLPPDELVVEAPRQRPTEPAWVPKSSASAPEPTPAATGLDEEYRPPADLTQLAAQGDPASTGAEPAPSTPPAPGTPTMGTVTRTPVTPEPVNVHAPEDPVETPAPVRTPPPPLPEPVGEPPVPGPERLEPVAARAPGAVGAPPATHPPSSAMWQDQPDPLQPRHDPPAAAPRPMRGRERERRMSMGEALIQLGYGDVQTHELQDPRLEQTLLKAGRINEEQAFRAQALTRHLEFVDAVQNPPSPDVTHLLDETTCKTLRVFPYRQDDGVFSVLTDTPQREVIIRTTVAERSGQAEVQLLVTTSTVLDRLIRDAYTAHTTLRDLAQEVAQQGPALEVDLDGDDNAVKRFVRDIITTAVSRGASDIHFEPTEAGLHVRYRIDKRLRLATTETVNKQGMGNVIRVLKLMANMDVGNNREPQDNRILLRLGTGRVNLRASSMPLSEGHEKIVLRLLKEANDIPEIEQLSMHPRTFDRFQQMIAQPDGMILVTGPTGSGKSFTLYSGLKRVSREENNVQTLEDPIEYQLPGINQAQINESAGYTFERALRTAMRQDPDVILVGEIRDTETAKVAIAAANTGHLLLSTLHTNDAPSAVQRLRNIGVEDYNIAPALRGVLAQRLVPRVCPHCSEETALPQHAQDRLKQARLPTTGKARRVNPAGCSRCERGRKGLIPVHELLVVDAGMRERISQGATVDDLRAHALLRGMLDLITDGYAKVAEGLVDLDDVESVVNADLDLTPAHA